jgi:hypothetical protein
MATRVALWGFDDEKAIVKAVFYLGPDGTVGIEAADEALARYALGLVESGIQGKDGRTYHRRDGQAFLDNLRYHFRSRYTWVRDEPTP